jgi:hypothetical protein
MLEESMMLLAYYLIITLLLTSCAPALQAYHDKCDLKQMDKQGSGYTMGVFPCKLTHWDASPQIREGGQSFERKQP